MASIPEALLVVITVVEVSAAAGSTPEIRVIVQSLTVKIWTWMTSHIVQCTQLILFF